MPAQCFLVSSPCHRQDERASFPPLQPTLSDLGPLSGRLSNAAAAALPPVWGAGAALPFGP